MRVGDADDAPTDTGIGQGEQLAEPMRYSLQSKVGEDLTGPRLHQLPLFMRFFR
jgi:hypothetical protein